MDWVGLRDPHVRAHRADFGELLEEQATAVMSLFEQQPRAVPVPAVFDSSLWDRRLRDRLVVRNKLTAVDYGLALAVFLGAGFDSAALDAFLLVNAAVTARAFNAATEDGLQEALAADAPSKALAVTFVTLGGSRLDRLAESTVTTSGNFGAFKAAEQADMRAKVWRTTSGKPRSMHAAMNGQRAALGEAFSNGMQWPGDPAGGADNNSNCRCVVDFEGG